MPQLARVFLQPKTPRPYTHTTQNPRGLTSILRRGRGIPFTLHHVSYQQSYAANAVSSFTHKSLARLQLLLYLHFSICLFSTFDHSGAGHRGPVRSTGDSTTSLHLISFLYSIFPHSGAGHRGISDTDRESVSRRLRRSGSNYFISSGLRVFHRQFSSLKLINENYY